MADAAPPIPWSVLVVDDHEGFSALLDVWFGRDGRFKVVGIACDGDEAVDLAAAHRPDLVVLDDDMPSLSGLEAISEIHEVSPASRIVMYSATAAVDRVDLALMLGADGFVSKVSPLDALIRTAVHALGVGDGSDASPR